MEVVVSDSNLEQALRLLKKKMQREGVYKEMKVHKRYEKPSEKKKRKSTEARRRSRKMTKKYSDRETY